MEITTDFADPQLSNEGVWMDYRSESKVRVAGIGNPKFISDQERQRNSFSGMRRGRDGRLAADLETKILCKSMAKYILVDWKGFTKKGKILKYSEENAFDLLVGNVFFRNDIAAIASEEGNYLNDLIEEDAKNSGSALAGT